MTSTGSRGASKTAQRRYSPSVRRAMILQDAKGCLLEKGLDNTTVRDIASWCGLSPGTLTYHFDSVDDILVEVLAEASAEYLASNLARARTGRTASERLTQLLTGGLPADDAARKMWRMWVACWSRAPYDTRFATVHASRHEHERAAIEALIAEGVADGDMAVDDVRQAAMELLGLLDGLGLQAYVSEESMPVEVAARIVADRVNDLRAT